MVDPDHERRRETADVVLYWMRRRGLTRQVFADRMGRSLSWVDKIRAGDRQLDRVSVLRQIARVLDIPLAVLIDPEEAERRRVCPDDREIATIRKALSRYDVMTNVVRGSDGPAAEPRLIELERSVRFGWMAFQASNYQAVGELLADLIEDAQAAVWQFAEDERRQARIWLAWTYQLTAESAFKLGDPQLGWLAADRGIQVAEQTGDLAVIGSAARRVAHALSASRQGRDAVRLVKSAAERLAPHVSDTDPALTSAYGMLLLKGSVAAAHLGQAADVRDLQNEAFAAAARLGVDRNDNWSAFGPTNVSVYRVSTLADMQGGGRVVEAADEISPVDLGRLPRERRASHLLDVARGHLQTGQRDDAAAMVLRADQLAAGEVRCRDTAKSIIVDLVRSYPRGMTPVSGITRLARAVGVTV